MLYASLKILHLLAIIVWLGGMVFTHFFLRPAVAGLQPAERLRLMYGVLSRFFAAVLVSVAVVLVTGSWMIGRTAAQMAQSGLRFSMPIEWMVMASLGFVMALLFGYIRLVPFRRLSHAVKSLDWSKGAAALIQIRALVLVNLALGLLIVVVTLLGLAA